MRANDRTHWLLALITIALLGLGVPTRAQDAKTADDAKAAEGKEAADDAAKEDAAKEDAAKEEPKTDDAKEDAKDDAKEDAKEDAKDDAKDDAKEDAKEDVKDDAKEDDAKENGGDKADASAEKKIEAKAEPVLTGLDNPCGVAVQPGSSQVYVSESGAYRVVRVKEDGKAEDVVTGFPEDVYGKGPKYNIGPLGLAFLNKNALIVGGGGNPDGEELLRVYEVPEAGKSVTADAMREKVGPIGPGEASKKGEGNFYAVAVTPTAVYVTCNGDDTKGWVSRAEVKEGKLADLVPYLATKEATEVDAPVGIAINRLGHVVIGQMGEINVPGDSLLTFYGPKSKRMLLNLKTGLHDIAALAYSPKGRLYALDYAWMDTSKGGLFRLDDDGKGGVEAVKVMSLDRPTSMAFASDGSLYVTEFGAAKEGSDEKTGRLLKVTGDL